MMTTLGNSLGPASSSVQRMQPASAHSTVYAATDHDDDDRESNLQVRSAQTTPEAQSRPRAASAPHTHLSDDDQNLEINGGSG